MGRKSSEDSRNKAIINDLQHAVEAAFQAQADVPRLTMQSIRERSWKARFRRFQDFVENERPGGLGVSVTELIDLCEKDRLAQGYIKETISNDPSWDIVNLDDLEGIAYHEAGHAVAASTQKIEFEDVTIIPKDDFSGYIRHRFSIF